ncbi:hypothetical protein [uncultured Draconibacterium sp.]|uniref:hypothetical protein n=1 Tax=uncultured Draconibacterium sp. TaxID=1573823 RepID=UPI0029C98C3C|nr:hypothetical protein [uncultured Draconibacterium sp.]
MKLFKNIPYSFLLILLLLACSEETIIPEQTKGIFGELKSGITQQPIQGTKIYLLDRNISVEPHGPFGVTFSDIKYTSRDSTETDINGNFSFEKELWGETGIYISDRQNTYSLVDSTDHLLVNIDSTNYEFIELEAVPTPIRDSFEIELEIFNVINRNYGGQIQEDYFLTHPIKISSLRTETQFGILEKKILLETKTISSDSSGVINLKFKILQGYSDIFYSLNNTMMFIADATDIDINYNLPGRRGIYVFLPLSDTLSYRKYKVDYLDIDEYFGQVRFYE